MQIGEAKTVYTDMRHVSDEKVVSSLQKGQRFAVIKRNLPSHVAFIVSLSTVVIKGTATISGFSLISGIIFFI
jgi:hypothetical protein